MVMVLRYSPLGSPTIKVAMLSTVMTFVNGDLQARFMTRIRGLDPQRCLTVPVDVGKAIAVALVADHYGEIIVAPFEFVNNTFQPNRSRFPARITEDGIDSSDAICGMT
jgi:hypothetical protein